MRRRGIPQTPYKDLGVAAAELLRIHCFDALACPAGVVNYWGYQTVNFFAPHPQYSSNRDPLGPVNELRERAGSPWRRCVETLLCSLEKIVEWQSAVPVPGPTYRAGPRSVVVISAPVAKPVT